jgi:predicted hydrocarbon binding protein
MKAEKQMTESAPQQYSAHNYYTAEKFFTRPERGILINRYRQRMMWVTEDFIVSFHQALEQDVGEAAGEIMYRCGYEWGRQDIAGFEQRFKEEFGFPIEQAVLGMALETWWWPLQMAGWGAWRFDLTFRKEGLIFIDLFDSAVAKSIGNIGKFACHYYAGFFAAVFGHLAKRELGGIEIQCYSMGESFCKFMIAGSKRVDAVQFWVREGATAKEIITRL